MPALLLPLLASLVVTATPADTVLCTAAAKFLRSDVLRMQALIDTDTLDDWRTGKKTSGCRVTAVGATDIGVTREAVRFYERVRAAGWKRTPDPIDMPNEGALRFRWESADCLFHVNREPLLGTMAETRVNNALKLGPGETPYQIFVVCVPAAPAKPR
ncbi:MAG: hypothetical protein ABI120_02440 [Gemmatimonadaceae bacterium]